MLAFFVVFIAITIFCHFERSREILVLVLLFFLFHHMFGSFAKNVFDMFIIKGVKNIFAIASGTDQISLPQDTQLMGDGRFCHIKQHCQRTDAHLTVAECAEYIAPGTVAHDFK